MRSRGTPCRWNMSSPFGIRPDWQGPRRQARAYRGGRATWRRERGVPAADPQVPAGGIGAHRGAGEHQPVHDGTVLERQQLPDPTAHRGAVDRGLVQSESGQHGHRVGGEHGRRPGRPVRPRLARGAARAGAAVVERDRPEVLGERVAQPVPPAVRVPLSLEQQERRRILGPWPWPWPASVEPSSVRTVVPCTGPPAGSSSPATPGLRTFPGSTRIPAPSPRTYLVDGGDRDREAHG